MFDTVITAAVTDISDSLIVIVPAVLAVAGGLVAAKIGWRWVRRIG